MRCVTAHKSETCHSALPAADVRFAADTARATLSRGGAVYARGQTRWTARGVVVTLRAARRLRAGHYLLTLTRAARVVARLEVTIGAAG
jgi:hypothetical protein